MYILRHDWFKINLMQKCLHHPLNMVFLLAIDQIGPRVMLFLPIKSELSNSNPKQSVSLPVNQDQSQQLLILQNSQLKKDNQHPVNQAISAANSNPNAFNIVCQVIPITYHHIALHIPLGSLILEPVII